MLLYIILAAVTIVEGPQPVYNAKIGDEVSFTCRVEGTDEPPSWNINGVDFYVSELPSTMFYSMPEHQLKVMVTTAALDRSMFYCFYVEYFFGNFTRNRSKSAGLFIAASTTLFPNVLVNNAIDLGAHKTSESAPLPLHGSPEAYSKQAHNFGKHNDRSCYIL